MGDARADRVTPRRRESRAIAVASRPASVELRRVSKVFPGHVKAVTGVELHVEAGEFFTAVGPSGSGKSTLLRMVAGLETPSNGTVWVDGIDVTGLPPRERGVAMVFQAPALYPHLSVLENLAFGLRARGVARREVDTRVGEVAALLDVTGLLDRRPASLSGGERQRVALGRAIAIRPSVLLMDEPLSSLDAPLRASIRAELRDFHRRAGVTVLYVTHDQSEALALGDRLGVMDRGELTQVGTPREVYDRPATRFVGQFLGSPPMSIVPCDVFDGEGGLRVVASGLDRMRSFLVPGGRLASALGRLRGRGVDLGLRPEHLSVVHDGSEVTRITGEVVVRRVEFFGHEVLATVELGLHSLSLRQGPCSALRSGDRLTIGIDLARATWFDPQSGLALPTNEP